MSPAPRFIDIYLLDSLGEKGYENLNCQQRKQGKGERSGKRKEKKEIILLTQVHCHPHFTSILTMSLKKSSGQYRSLSIS